MSNINEQLRRACKRGHFDEVVWLIDEGADINEEVEDEEDWDPDWAGYTALLYAASHEREEICKYLLDKGADIHHKARYGDTALHEAAYYGADAALKLLIKRGSNLHLRNDLDRFNVTFNQTPLDVAKECNHTSTVSILEDAIKNKLVSSSKH